MTTPDLLPPSMCEELFGTAARAAQSAGVRDVEVSMHGSAEALTRFSNNQIHQNVAERVRSLSIRLIIDGRTARVATNRLDTDGIEAAVQQAIYVTRASEPDPDLLPLYFDSEKLDGNRYDPETTDCTAADRARGVGAAIATVEAGGCIGAGIFSTAESVEAIYNTAGLSRYYTDTLSQFSITAMAGDSSGWAKATSVRMPNLDPEALARRATEKARLSANPSVVPPGEYTVVLEPAAVLDLVGQIFGDFSATALVDQRSFLNERLGEKLFGGNISIWDEVASSLQAGPPFDGEGVPRQRLHLVHRGVITDIARCRSQAAKLALPATGHGFALPNETGESPVNIVMAGDTKSLEDLIAGTRNGILVTRLWYIREVEPYEKIMTGMTRDGTFLISDGEIAGGLRNMRFNQSVIELLRNVEELSLSVRSSGEEAFDMVVPGMKANGFHFTEVTRY